MEQVGGFYHRLFDFMLFLVENQWKNHKKYVILRIKEIIVRINQSIFNMKEIEVFIAGSKTLAHLRDSARAALMELNNQFITNPDFAAVELALEKYFYAYRQAGSPETRENGISLDIELEGFSKEHQNVVNYLVYLEGIAALVNEGVLHLDVITDLMAYRYFIAVNNPVIQDTELLPYQKLLLFTRITTGASSASMSNGPKPWEKPKSPWRTIPSQNK